MLFHGYSQRSHEELPGFFWYSPIEQGVHSCATTPSLKYPAEHGTQ